MISAMPPQLGQAGLDSFLNTGLGFANALDPMANLNLGNIGLNSFGNAAAGLGGLGGGLAGGFGNALGGSLLGGIPGLGAPQSSNNLLSLLGGAQPASSNPLAALTGMMDPLGLGTQSVGGGDPLIQMLLSQLPPEMGQMLSLIMPMIDGGSSRTRRRSEDGEQISTEPPAPPPPKGPEKASLDNGALVLAQKHLDALANDNSPETRKRIIREAALEAAGTQDKRMAISKLLGIEIKSGRNKDREGAALFDRWVDQAAGKLQAPAANTTATATNVAQTNQTNMNNGQNNMVNNA